MDDILGAWVSKVNVQPNKRVVIQSVLKERFPPSKADLLLKKSTLSLSILI